MRAVCHGDRRRSRSQCRQSRASLPLRQTVALRRVALRRVALRCVALRALRCLQCPRRAARRQCCARLRTPRPALALSVLPCDVTTYTARTPRTAKGAFDKEGGAGCRRESRPISLWRSQVGRTERVPRTARKTRPRHSDSPNPHKLVRHPFPFLDPAACCARQSTAGARAQWRPRACQSAEGVRNIARWRNIVCLRAQGNTSYH